MKTAAVDNWRLASLRNNVREPVVGACVRQRPHSVTSSAAHDRVVEQPQIPRVEHNLVYTTRSWPADLATTAAAMLLVHKCVRAVVTTQYIGAPDASQ